MSAQPKTRVAAPSRWIHGAVAAFVLVSCAFAQTDNKEKEKEKKPAPAAHKAQDKGTPPAESHPSNGTTTPPPNNPPSTPAVRNTNGTPPPTGERTPRPPASGGTVTPATSGSTPGRQFGSGGAPSGTTPGATPGRQFGSGAANGTAMRNGPPAAAGVSGGSRPVYHGANGSEVRYRSNGQPQMVQARGITITHTPSGVRRAEFVRPDHSVIVTQGAHYGYVQRPFAVNNVSYVQRTYVVGGVSRVHIYRPYVYRGISLNLYVSSRYYAPAYYGWVGNPWARPVVFSFGWGGSPWFGFYGGYFAPYPSYIGPNYWLTDYIMAMTLQDAYQQQLDAAAAAQANSGYGSYPGSQPALTPDVKQAIADEVHRQLDQERAESQSMGGAPGAPQFLADNSSHVFVVANALDVQSPYGECGLTEGDVIQMTAPPPANSATANLAVLASKGQDCRKGSMVSVAIPDLQDMQNHMRETLDQGLADLQSRQGQGGIPAEPVAAQAAPVTAPYAAAAPPPDPNIAAEVSQQSESATQAETDVLAQAQAAPPAAGGAPTSVTLGMTVDQVTQLLGQPQVVGDLGSKKTYFYGNMKVIFTDGKVSDIQ